MGTIVLVISYTENYRMSTLFLSWHIIIIYYYTSFHGLRLSHAHRPYTACTLKRHEDLYKF